MKRDRVKTADIEYYTELNFDLDSWEKLLGTGLTNNTLRELNKKLRINMSKRFSPGSKTYREWPPLAPVTVKYKGGSKRKLWQTGRMSRSFRSTIYASELVITNTAPQSGILQRGSIITTTEKQSFWLWHNVFNKKGDPLKPRKIFIPPRPFLGFDDRDIKLVNRTIEKHLKKTERLGKYKL